MKGLKNRVAVCILFFGLSGFAQSGIWPFEVDHDVSGISQNTQGINGERIAGFKTRQSVPRDTINTKYIDKLPPEDTPYQVISYNEGNITHSANVYFWNEDNEAYIRFVPQGQHFFVSPYDFIFTQEGLQRSGVYFNPTLYTGYQGNIYRPMTFGIGGWSFCNGGVDFNRPFDAQYANVHFSYEPVISGPLSVCEESSCYTLARPQELTPVHVTLASGEEADIYVWRSDDGHAYMDIKPINGVFHFSEGKFSVVQNGMEVEVSYRACGWGVIGETGEIKQETIIEIKTSSYSNYDLIPFDPTSGFSLYVVSYEMYDYSSIQFHPLYEHDAVIAMPELNDKLPPENAASIVIREGSDYEVNVSLWSEQNEAFMRVVPTHALSYLPDRQIIQDGTTKEVAIRRDENETWGYDKHLISRPMTFKITAPSYAECIKFDATRPFEMRMDWLYQLTYTPSAPSQNAPAVSTGTTYYGDKVPPPEIEPTRYKALMPWFSDADVYIWSENNLPYIRVVPQGANVVCINTFGVYSSYMFLIQDTLAMNAYAQKCSNSGSSLKTFFSPETVRLDVDTFADTDVIADMARSMQLIGDNKTYETDTPARYEPSFPHESSPVSTLLPPVGARSMEFEALKAYFWHENNNTYVHFKPKEGVARFEMPAMEFVQDGSAKDIEFTSRETDERDSYDDASYRGAFYGPTTLRLYTYGSSYTYEWDYVYKLNLQQPFQVYNLESTRASYPSVTVAPKNGMLPVLMYLLN